jgi:hypothetical protein
LFDDLVQKISDLENISATLKGGLTMSRFETVTYRSSGCPTVRHHAVGQTEIFSSFITEYSFKNQKKCPEFTMLKMICSATFHQGLSNAKTYSLNPI